MHAQEFRVEVIDTPDGFREHEKLQNLVWGYDPPGAVPTHFLTAISHNGGLVLGAYAETAMIGLLLGVPSIREGRVTHLSHLLGVHPAWRGRGVGEAIKWRQRELVLAQGIDTITWTFDPLESANARLNIARLGGIVRTYAPDYYGPMDDALNRGIPSDRLIVEWLLDSPRVTRRAAGSVTEDRDAPIALGSEPGPDGLRRPDAFDAPATSAALVEFPLRMQEIKRRAPNVAMAWRLAVRAACQSLFARGYAATDVVRRDDRIFYYLEHTSL